MRAPIWSLQLVSKNRIFRRSRRSSPKSNLLENPPCGLNTWSHLSSSVFPLLFRNLTSEGCNFFPLGLTDIIDEAAQVQWLRTDPDQQWGQPEEMVTPRLETMAESSRFKKKVHFPEVRCGRARVFCSRPVRVALGRVVGGWLWRRWLCAGCV